MLLNQSDYLVYTNDVMIEQILRATVEGVETRAELNTLRELGVEFF